jgi:hypothetical protein
VIADHFVFQDPHIVNAPMIKNFARKSHGRCSESKFCKRVGAARGEMADGGGRESGRAEIDVKVVKATSGRSKCQRCKESISKESYRVSFPGRHNGISCVKWLHPACFAQHCMRVDYAPTGQAKCHGEGRPIPKGEVRLVLQLTACNGDVSSRKIYHPSSPTAVSFLSSLLSLEECQESVSIEKLSETLDGPPEHRAWVVEALKGRDVAAQAVPTRGAAPVVSGTEALKEGVVNGTAAGAQKPPKPPKSKAKQREKAKKPSVPAADGKESRFFEAGREDVEGDRKRRPPPPTEASPLVARAEGMAEGSGAVKRARVVEVARAPTEPSWAGEQEEEEEAGELVD